MQTLWQDLRFCSKAWHYIFINTQAQTQNRDNFCMSSRIKLGGYVFLMVVLISSTLFAQAPDHQQSFAGVWRSDEADASFTIVVEGGQAFFVQRPATRQPLRPQYKDHFSVGVGPGQALWATRDVQGRITKLHIGASRMRDMPFERVGAK
jgi:hypothetical protein